MNAVRLCGTHRVLIAALVLCFAPAIPALSADAVSTLLAALHNGRTKIVDLSFPLDEHAPYWPEGTGPTPFHAKVVATYAKDQYFAREITLPEHFGTHMDAPLHFDPQGWSLDRIPVDRFIVPAVVIDVRKPRGSTVDYRVTGADIRNWEKVHGAIPQGALVFFYTGWSARWPSQAKYMNQDAHGVLHFPGLSVEAAQYLLASAHPVGIGIDAASIDYGPSQKFEVHHLTMKAGLYHLENVANLQRVPATGALAIALPMKLTGGSGSPTRVLALVPASHSTSH
jgi:kynurenine formamidase